MTVGLFYIDVRSQTQNLDQNVSIIYKFWVLTGISVEFFFNHI